MSMPIILAENLLEDATMTLPNADTYPTGYEFTNAIDRRRYTVWASAVYASEQIAIADCRTAHPANTVVVQTQLPVDATSNIAVDVSTNGSDWVNRLPTTIVPGAVTMLTFTTVSARYWRITLNNVLGTVGPPNRGVPELWLGTRLTFPRYPESGFDPDAETLQATTARSKTGHVIGSTLRYRKRNLSIDFANLTDTWVATYFQPTWETYLSQLKPFWFAWDLSGHPTEVYLCTVPGDFSLRMPFTPFRRSLRLELETQVEDA